MNELKCKFIYFSIKFITKLLFIPYTSISFTLLLIDIKTLKFLVESHFFIAKSGVLE